MASNSGVIPWDPLSFIIFVIHEYPFNGVQLKNYSFTATSDKPRVSIFKPPLVAKELGLRHMYIPALLWLYNPQNDVLDVTIYDASNVNLDVVYKRFSFSLGPKESRGISLPHWFVGELILEVPTDTTIILEGGWIILS